jgi:2Fe-2S ferredoxin
MKNGGSSGLLVPVATIDPSGIQVPVESYETLFDALWREGYEWPTVCYGQATCGTCYVEVCEGLEHANQPEPDEERLLERINRRIVETRAMLRLACRLQIAGPILAYRRLKSPDK